jgi:hypothetical protein
VNKDKKKDKPAVEGAKEIKLLVKLNNTFQVFHWG